MSNDSTPGFGFSIAEPEQLGSIREYAQGYLLRVKMPSGSWDEALITPEEYTLIQNFFEGIPPGASGHQFLIGYMMGAKARLRNIDK